ncbi:hypothetical protein VSH64_40610 [Amycolatopsis rhabdoformis]|uniref:Uncharacterized protein n=1 Tax=Amycolatopsis rhabdoformis TaxID=1448059 RepID=A0ABZ1I5D4_9PSEU|nr:hypothetical protein [Amycolatopsis rhabdoformis]WSE29058.1 hypothetical protein VSH64_40610 [Amycolatopsis rhabdoformis]
MARKTTPVVQEKSGNARGKIIGTLLVLGLLVVVIRQPAEAASFARAAFGWLGSVGDALASFGHAIAS